ncbi:MAG: hypothetical protein RBS73_00895 [Prolixibacteraceae bacterium]|jgi:hypothetical protein|nr:hypothetical protein [Prolixibacteraceae bacterium]
MNFLKTHLKSKRIRYRAFLDIFLLMAGFACARAQNVQVREQDHKVQLQNNLVSLGFNLTSGLFNLKNNEGETIVSQAYFQAGGLQSKDECQQRTWTAEDVQDELGTGKTLVVRVSFDNYADILWEATVYENQEFIVFNMGIVNDTDRPYRLMGFHPLASKQVYPGKDNRVNYQVLDGNSGGSATRVTGSVDLRSFNNLLVKFGDLKQPEILVAGGITYNEFEKFVQVTRTDQSLHLKLFSEDPVGKLIDAGQTYQLNEKFYLCFINKNPFEALEKYAGALKKAQQIDLNDYDFPTECLWYANVYSMDKNRRKFNDSKGAVEEMENAVKSGITKYTKVGIRLVPDAYGPNNQQGWWDDEHWGKWGDPLSAEGGNYVAPYLTTKSWAGAVTDLGGYPFTYMQSGRRSEDFVKLHPDWMLFNDPYRVVTGHQRFTQEFTYPNGYSLAYAGHWWTDKQLWGYDFTDPGFIEHMRKVYANLKDAGIKGIFFDYPEGTAWAFVGGFEDKYATTARAYRDMFRLADEGLGRDAMIQERNISRGSDITLGLVESQRVWGDANTFDPEMTSRCGLRWYKNRVVINYDTDSKDPQNCIPKNGDGRRAMLTMCYVTSGRFLLAPSFYQLTGEEMHDLSRIFPFHTVAKSARPLDAFTSAEKHPRIYDFEVDPTWHQLTFYNDNTTDPAVIHVELDKSLNEGGMELNPSRSYYVYDFWRNRLVGMYSGSDKLEQQLRPGEARMMSVHAKENNPQFLSTSRHIMQGMTDLKTCAWDASKRTLSGISEVVENETYKVVIATNGYKAKSCKSTGAKSSIKTVDEKAGLIELNINSPKNSSVNWTIRFKQNKNER